MQTISVNYTFVWQIKFAPHYKFTACKKLINTNRGIIVKKVVNGGCVGFYIHSKFYSVTALKTQIEKVAKQHCPF